MGFYEEISKYYDCIFPTGEEQVKFLFEVLGKPPKEVLDIACGTGGYSLALSRAGYNCTAVDLDGQMISLLEQKVRAEGRDIKFRTADMIDLDKQLAEKFNMAFCIGNSVVHLQNLQQIKDFIRSAKNLLENDGSLVLQIINFDRILLRDIKSLPAIEDRSRGLTFERNYDYDRGNNIIKFRTKLEVDGNSFNNEIPLYPLLSDEVVEALQAAGFKKLKLFGDFNGSEFDKYNSFMLVIWAR